MARALALALLLAACSGEPAPAPLAPPAPTAGEERRTEPAPAPREDPPEVAAAGLPDPLPTPESVPTRGARVADRWGGHVTYDLLEHPDEAVRAPLNTLLRALADETLLHYGGACRVRLAHARLVSVTCSYVSEVRGGIVGEAFAVHVAIEDGHLRPVELAELFAEGTDLGVIARERCLVEQRRIDATPAAEHYPFGPEGCSSSRAVVALGPTAAHVIYRHPMFYPQVEVQSTIAIEVPYAELRARVRLDGPLAAVLGAPPSAPAVTADAANAWAVTPYGTESQWIERWSALAPLVASTLSLQRWRGPLARLVARARPDESIAAHFGWRVEPVVIADLDALAPLRWGRTTSDLNLRAEGAEEGAAILGTLPRGSHVLAIGGLFGIRGSWASTWTPFGRGVLAARYLERIDGCVPARPEGFDERALTARVRVIQRNRAREAALFVRRAGRRTHVVLHGLEEDGCALGARLFAIEVAGAPGDVRLTTTHAVGGTTLLVVGTIGADGGVTYGAHLLGARGGPIWTARVRAASEHVVRLGETADGQWFPLTYADEARGGLVRLAWNGQTLAPAAPP